MTVETIKQAENTENTENSDIEQEAPKIQTISLKTMLESGSHFGHHKAHWNPKMAPYLYGCRNDVHIFDLRTTLELWHKIKGVIMKHMAKGGTILFTGTKKSARTIIEREAVRSNNFYISNKWPGGLLTNFDTVKKSIKTMVELEKFLIDADKEDTKIKITKKEKLMKRRELDKLVKVFWGIKEMKQLPGMLFVVDTIHDRIAIEEARKLNIPVIALVDSNADPACVDYPIPSNDDAKGTIDLFTSNVAEAAIIGRSQYELAMEKIAAENETLAESFIADKLE